MTVGIKYCRRCGSSMSLAWDGPKAYRERIDPDCRAKLTPEEVAKYFPKKEKKA